MTTKKKATLNVTMVLQIFCWTRYAGQCLRSQFEDMGCTHWVMCVAARYLAQISACVFDSDCRDNRLDVQAGFSMSTEVLDVTSPEAEKERMIG